MKTFALVCLLSLGSFVGVHAQNGLMNAKPANQPLYLINNAVYNPVSLAYIDPNNIESITVLRSDSANKLYHAPNGVVLITMKQGFGHFKKLVDFAGVETGMANLPKVYIINGGVELNPDSVVIDPLTVTSLKVVQSTQIATTDAKPTPMAIVLITIEGNIKPLEPQGKPGDTTIILR
jgi:hypothetical protein